MLEVALEHKAGDFALNADFTIAELGVTALFGPSGAGKSTTVSALAGLIRPQRGVIRFNGDTLLDTARRIEVPARARRFAVVFQDARLFPHLTVEANILFGARRAPTPPGGEQIAHITKLLDLAALLSRRPATLSGGERQRAAIARALLSNPRLLLLDEPMASIDGPRRGEVLPYLERLRDQAGLMMVYVSHSIDEVTRLADDIVVLNRGEVAAHGPVPEIMSRLDLFPLTGRFEAGAVIDAVISRHDARDNLTELAFSGGKLWLPKIEAEKGVGVRLRVRARDVMLALEKPKRTSANNILRCEVAEIRADQGAYVDVLLTCGAARLLARITNRSLRTLKLKPGLKLYAVIKSVNLDRYGRDHRGGKNRDKT